MTEDRAMGGRKSIGCVSFYTSDLICVMVRNNMSAFIHPHRKVFFSCPFICNTVQLISWDAAHALTVIMSLKNKLWNFCGGKKHNSETKASES